MRGAGEGRRVSWPAACSPPAHTPGAGKTRTRKCTKSVRQDFTKQVNLAGTGGWMSGQWGHHSLRLMARLTITITSQVPVSTFLPQVLSRITPLTVPGLHTPESLAWPELPTSRMATKLFTTRFQKINSYRHLAFFGH